MKLLLIIGFSLSFFTAVLLYKELELISLLMVVSLTIIPCVLLGPISIVMSRVFDLSSNFSFNLSSKVHQITEKRHGKILKQQLKSCPIIRCQIGNFYHMEAKAKLTTMHRMLDAVAFLLINFK